MFEIVTLKAMQAIEARFDPAIVFHGTSTCFSLEIEQHGWVVNTRPYEWSDIEWVIRLSEQLNTDAGAFLYFNHDSQRKRYANGSGAYFTHILEGALQYAGATGGETVREALRASNRILTAINERGAFEAEREKLLKLTKAWSEWVHDSLPVVYAVKANDDDFKRPGFETLVSNAKTSFEFQLREWGEIIQKAGDFWATRSIAPSAIIAKTVLSASDIEKL